MPALGLWPIFREGSAARKEMLMYRHVPALIGVALALSLAVPAMAADGDGAMQEADEILSVAAEQRNVSKEEFIETLVADDRFSADQNVFLPSALAVDFTENKPTVTLPLYEGIGPSGEPTHFIITEAGDFEVAEMMGLNYAPKLVNGRDTAGSQQVTIENGMIKFKGDVDFSPVRALAPGPFPNTFPPATAQPGSVGDAEYSPLVVLPSGSVLNAIIVANGTGEHDNLVSIDQDKRTVVFKLLDGFQGGDQYFYHISTESNDIAAATIESATYTPRLARSAGVRQERTGGRVGPAGFLAQCERRDRRRQPRTPGAEFDDPRRTCADQHLSAGSRQQQAGRQQLQPDVGCAHQRLDSRGNRCR
ncbi:MAG: hypothetical protein WKF78_07625 [Candidatus Limnocylindrales bacterium]